MSGVSFEAEMPDAEAFFAELLGRTRSAQQRAVELTATEAWGEIRKDAPVDHGRLAGAWMLEQIDDLSYRIHTNVEYARTVSEGAPAKTIYPVNARALRFEINGQVVFAKWAEIPARAGNPYVEDAIDRALSRANEFGALAIAEEQ